MPHLADDAHDVHPPASHRPAVTGGSERYDGFTGGQMSGERTPFGGWVRALRLKAGLTQAELAESSGISERTVSDLERGLRLSVYPATARQLAAALQVAKDDLPAFLLAARGHAPALAQNI